MYGCPEGLVWGDGVVMFWKSGTLAVLCADPPSMDAAAMAPKAKPAHVAVSRAACVCMCLCLYVYSMMLSEGEASARYCVKKD